MTTPLPEPAYNTVGMKVSTGDTSSLYKEHRITVDGVAAYTESQLKAYGAAEYKRGIDAAAAEFDKRATMPDGTKLEGWYEPDEPAEIIRKLGGKS